MMKYILPGLFTVLSLFSYGQTKNQIQLEALYQDQFCSCMSKDPSLSPEVLLSKTTSECIIEFQKSNADLMRKIVKEDYPENTSLSEQERADDSGVRMIKNTIVPLVRNCEFYRNTLTKYKSGMIYQLGVTKENAKKSIEELIQKEYMIKDPKSLAIYYTLLGVMHEYVSDKNAALSYYDKSLKLKETTATKGLRELLILNGGFQPEQKQEPKTTKL